MAISDKIPGLEVTVKIDGEPAIEHHDGAAYDEPCGVELDSPDGVRVVKYIEARSGAPFVVHLARSSNFCSFRGDHIGWSVSVDGGSSRCKQEISTTRPYRKPTYDSEISGPTMGDHASGFKAHRWKFGDLSIVSADARNASEQVKETSRAKSLGVITVCVYHMRTTNQFHLRRTSRQHREIDSVNEKELKGKALSLRTTLAAAGRVSNRTYSLDMKYHDPKRRPFAVFEFRYRTRDDLIKEAILRPSVNAPQGVDGAGAVIVIDDDDEDDDVPVKLKKDPAVVKKEHKPAAGFKREAEEDTPSRRFKQIRRPDGKFLVDLCDD